MCMQTAATYSGYRARELACGCNKEPRTQGQATANGGPSAPRAACRSFAKCQANGQALPTPHLLARSVTASEGRSRLQDAAPCSFCVPSADSAAASDHRTLLANHAQIRKCNLNLQTSCADSCISSGAQGSLRRCQCSSNVIR